MFATMRLQMLRSRRGFDILALRGMSSERWVVCQSLSAEPQESVHFVHFASDLALPKQVPIGLIHSK